MAGIWGGIGEPGAIAPQPENAGVFQPGLDINDPNVWHQPDAQYNQTNRDAAVHDLMGYVGSNFGGTSGPPQQSYPMTAEAQKVMSQQNFPIDPNRIVFDGPWNDPSGMGSFRLDSVTGPDIFGGRLPKVPYGQIPRELQPLLAPSMVRYYNSQDYQGGAVRGQMSAPWTQFFAPPAPSPNTGQFGSSWPGITRYDPWHRAMGEYASLYS